MKAFPCSPVGPKGNLQLSHILLGDSLPWGGFGLSDTVQWEQALCPEMGSYRVRNWWDMVVSLQGSALGWFVSGVLSSASLGGNLGVPESPTCPSPNKRATLDFHPQPCSGHSSRRPSAELGWPNVLGHHTAVVSASSFLAPAIPSEMNVQPPAQDHQHFICARSRGCALAVLKAPLTSCGSQQPWPAPRGCWPGQRCCSTP